MKKGNTPMECDLKGLFKSTVEETKLKEKYTVSSIWKKSFRHLHYQFQFRFFSASFKNEMRTLLKQFYTTRFIDYSMLEGLWRKLQSC